MEDRMEVAKLILEQINHRPIKEVIEYIEAEIMMMEIDIAKAKEAPHE